MKGQHRADLGPLEALPVEETVPRNDEPRSVLLFERSRCRIIELA